MPKNLKWLDEILINEREFKQIVLENGFKYINKDKSNLKNRKKHIVFLAYHSKKSYDFFYCISTTTTLKPDLLRQGSQILVFNHLGKHVYLNLTNLFVANWSNLKNPIVRKGQPYRKIAHMIVNGFSNKKLKTLSYNTNLQIWKDIIENRKKNNLNYHLNQTELNFTKNNK